MPKTRYFGYQIPNTNATLIGTQPKQIVKIIEYYHKEREMWKDVSVPSRDQIYELEEINITCVFPLAKVDHNIRAEVRPNFIFWINSNAFDYMKEVAASYEELKREELFKFQTLPIFGLWFLPEYIMQGLRKYKWQQNQQQIDEWLSERERDLDVAEARV